MSLHEAPDVPVWSSVLDQLLTDDRVTPQLHGFLNLAVPQGVMGGTLYLDVPNDLTAAQFNKRMRAPILEALAQVQGDDPQIGTFRVVVNPDVIETQRSSSAAPSEERAIPAAPTHAALTEQAPEPIVPASRNDTRLNPKYTFDNFVIGQSNRFAHAAAVAVAEAPAKAYNPCSSTGTPGSARPTSSTRSATTPRACMPHPCPLRVERGVHERLHQLDRQQPRLCVPSALPRRRHPPDRRHPVPAGSRRDAGSVLPHFNTLHDHDKQVVITSDLPPKQLTGFEDRMRSRFEWGLITDVQAPDLETRIAILRKKAQSERLLIPDDVLEYIATVVSSNIRELEGALIRVSAFASLNRSTLDMSLAQTVLRDIIDQDDANVISPTDIITATAQYFKLSVDDLYGSSRSQAVATARQIAMYLCRERTSLSLPKIGQLFGNRDHTTVMYAYKKISDLMKERRSIFNQVSEITSQLGRMR